jgi:hypothetical protein
MHSKSRAIPFSEDRNSYSDDPITLITQFFIHRNPVRHKEIVYCLQQNCSNPHIETIYLLNERIYNKIELQLNDESMKKIRQINIKTRITFKHIFDTIESSQIKGFVVALNSDIMVDDTITRVRSTPIFEKPTLVALLRYEYNDIYVPFETNCSQSKLFGPRGDSQDTWIIHTNHNIPVKYRGLFDFQFGKPGCDNKMVYLFHFLNYQVYNDPLAIKTYHYHQSQDRSYSANDRLIPVFEYLTPPNLPNVLYKNAEDMTAKYTRWNFEDNTKLRNTLLETSEPFVICAENENKSVLASISQYYLWDANHTPIPKDINENAFPNKSPVWGELRNIIHFIFRGPWTHALENKTLLIVSPFASSMKGQVGKPIFPVEIFLNNTFIFMESISPTTVLPDFDVALIDVGNPGLCAHYLFTTKGKSTICMGKALSLMFGLYDINDLQIFQDFSKTFLNKHWKRI